MSNQDRSDNLIAKMLHETFEGNNTQEEAEVVDFQSYFEKKTLPEVASKKAEPLVTAKQIESTNLESFLDHEYIPFFKGGFNKGNRCFRFRMFQDIIDLPQNWYGLEELKESFESGANYFHHLDEQNDQGDLLKAFGHYKSHLGHLVFCNLENELFLILFSDSEKTLLETTLEFLKSSKIQLSQAA